MTEFVSAAVFLFVGTAFISYLYSTVLFERVAVPTHTHRRPSQYLGFERREPTRTDRRTIDYRVSQERRGTQGRRMIDAGN